MPLTAGQTPPLNTNAVAINGTAEEKLDRLALREIAETWPCSRDTYEWPRYRDIFSDDGYVFTTWSGGKHIDDFIKVSIEGFQNGEKIRHQALGVVSDLIPSTARAITRMHTVIVQRFSLPRASPEYEGETCEVDVDCQCRFVYLCEKKDGDWKVHYYKVFYYRDRMIPVDPRKLPKLDDEKLASMPYGYRFLGYCQSLLGHAVLKDLPEASGEEHDRFTEAMVKWGEGADKKTTDQWLKIDRNAQ